MRFHHGWLNSVAIAIAVWLSAWTLQPMFADTSYLDWVPVLVGSAAVVGSLGSLSRIPRTIVLALQAVVMGAVLLLLGVRHAPPDAVADSPWYEPLYALAAIGTATVRNSTTPLPVEWGLVWLLLCILAVVLLATEFLVAVLEQPAWSLAPLSVVYGVGAVTLTTELESTAFAAVAAGYVLILLASTRLAGTRRGRALAHAGGPAIAAAMLVAVLVAAPALTGLLPLGEKQPWLQAGGNGPIELTDPKVTLNENLRRPAEQVVLRYSTDSETPVYLRTVALTELTTSGAELTAMELSTYGLGGAYDAPGRTVTTRVRMQLPSEYLPAPFAADRFSADGDWAFERDTMSILATGEDRTEQTEGLEYEVTSTVPDPSPEELDAATAGTSPAGTQALTVPEGLSPDVAALTDSVVEGATTDGERAQAIQSFLRSKDFTYSLTAPDTAGMDDISDFLLAERAGYCIHFAAGMITMARLQGIPARMAIGFTPGTRDGDEWVVTTHNMHSWPELYFEDLGWVPFEPTKSVAGPPAYTDPDEDQDEAPSPSTSPSAAPPSAAPTASAVPTAEPSASPAPATDDSTSPAGVALWVALGLAVLVALPVAARTVARLWRLRGGQSAAEAAESAWREVRALAADVGVEWNDGSPVLASHELWSRVGPAAGAELAAVAGVVERVRYARGGADTSLLAARVRAFRRALLDGLPRGRRLRALFLPSSLLPRAGASGDSFRGA